MNWLQQLADWFNRLKCWYLVRPWEQAICVRAGKRVYTIAPGLHLRLPFLDEVFIQNTRLRALNLPVQTVTNKSGQNVTLSGIVSWRIVDVQAIYEKLHTPEDWIYNTVLSVIAEAIFESDGDASPLELSKRATAKLQTAVTNIGLHIESVSITDFSAVRTLRLITGEGNTGWSWNRVGPLDQVNQR